MQQELARRQSLEDQLYAFVLAHPRRWLLWYELSTVAGQAWRSRVPKVRERLEKLDLELVWNKKNGNASAYMLRDKALGPAAHVYREASLF